ncbi:MAG: hypothetical protein ABIJ49_20495, partial [Pseudomonadota bacterium]
TILLSERQAIAHILDYRFVMLRSRGRYPLFFKVSPMAISYLPGLARQIKTAVAGAECNTVIELKQAHHAA